MAARPASHPRPFDYQEPSTNHLPLMDEDDVAGLEAVIKALAQGRYPRLESVPNALNAYNCDRKLENGERKAWSYFHLIADFVRPADARPLKNAPRIDLDHGILDDLKAPWPRLWPIRAVVEEDSDGRSLVLSTPASYRFICFIHRHKICIRQSRQKAVYTISIWDREAEELTWHDTYPHDRLERQQAIRQFWEEVIMPDMDFASPREDFVANIRYRMVYRTCEDIESATRESVPPRNTLYAIMAIAIQHMNRARTDSSVSIVPDRLDIFGGFARDLIPRFFVHILVLLPRAPKKDDAGSDESFQSEKAVDDKKEYIRKFKILDRLKWMKFRVLRELRDQIGADSEDFEMVVEALKIGN